jgi:hypothetical protein
VEAQVDVLATCTASRAHLPPATTRMSSHEAVLVLAHMLDLRAAHSVNVLVKAVLWVEEAAARVMCTGERPRPDGRAP